MEAGTAKPPHSGPSELQVGRVALERLPDLALGLLAELVLNEAVCTQAAARRDGVLSVARWFEASPHLSL